MSKKIGLFFGTTTGKTETVAESIQKAFGDIDVELHDISQTEATDFNEYECLIIGSPTWNLGDLQDDWEGFFTELDEIDFSGKTMQSDFPEYAPLAISHFLYVSYIQYI